jgi:hypothetical protein
MTRRSLNFVLARIVEPTTNADSQRVLEDVGHARVLRTMFRPLSRAANRDYRAANASVHFTMRSWSTT